MKRFILPIIFILSLIASQAWSATIMMNPKFHAEYEGEPVSSGLLYTYSAGTTTAKATYTDRDAGTENANPVVLDSNGDATVYGTGSYKFVLYTDTDGDGTGDTLIWTMDNIRGLNETAFTTIGDYDDDFDAAITSISSTEMVLYVDDTATMSAVVTVPSTLTVVLEKGGSIDQSENALTINGPLILNGGTITNDAALTINGFVRYDGSYAVFSSTSYGTFGTSATDKVYPDMWGANTTPGTTDMTAEIQAAVDSLTSGTVFFKNQTYLIGSPIIPETNVHFSGKGTIKLAANSDDDMFDITGSDTDISWEGLTFDGNGANQTGGTGTNIIHATTQAKRLYVTNCIFKNAAASAIRMDGSLAHEDVMVKNNHFIDYYSAGIIFYGTNRGTISDNIFDNTGVSPSGNGNGVSISSSSYDVTVSGNSISMGTSGAESFGIETGTSGAVSSKIAITGNTINAGDQTNNGGISVAYTTNSTVSGNTVTKTKAVGGIEVTYSSAISVTGNSIYDVDSIAIANNADNHTISIVGNSIDAYTSYGITVSISTGTLANIYDISILGNTLSNGTGTSTPPLYINDAPKYGLNISNNNIYTNASSIGLNIISSATMTGFNVTGNIFYNCTKWISISGSTNTNYNISNNNITSCPTAPDFEGSGHIIVNNTPSEQSLTGTVTVDRYSASGDIDSNGGAVTATLGDGYYIGQTKLISMSDASTSSTLSVTHHETSDPEVFTFDAVDEYWFGVWTGTEWATVSATATT